MDGRKDAGGAFRSSALIRGRAVVREVLSSPSRVVHCRVANGHSPSKQGMPQCALAGCLHACCT